MLAMLEIKGEKNVTIQPYLPEKFVSGYLPKKYDCLISIDCEGCYIESVKPSPTGKAYYTTSKQH